MLLAPNGARIGDESVGYSGFASTVAAHGDQGFVLFDSRIRNYVSEYEPELAELVSTAGVVEAPDAAATRPPDRRDPAAACASEPRSFVQLISRRTVRTRPTASGAATQRTTATMICAV